ncbi:MAG TPA: glycosyltransferase family 4 protein [Candidatus Sulfotelmatobacter sp.]|nr:glycosyltransferase family 4 protein [Candidatus Sulfotelmatobacter sp.]
MPAALTEPLAILYDHVADVGGAERYWETVVPALTDAGVDVRLFGRIVDEKHRFGVPATEIRWSDEDHDPSPEAARAVADAVRATGASTVASASIFDAEVLRAIRAVAKRWVARLHDHRAFCPTGDRIFPQFPAICTHPMGNACRVNAVLRGCVHGPRPSSEHALARRKAVRDALATADVITVASEMMRRSAIMNGIDPARIVVISPALRREAYRAVPAPRPARDALLFAGRLVPNKGLRPLIAALARIPAARRPLLVVAGRGEQEERDARTDAQRLDVAVDWRGWLNVAQLREAIDETTAVTMPSTWPEPFGLTGVEGQARGRPAVAFDVGGISDWLGDAGVLVPRNDTAALARAIEQVFDPANWAQYAEAAHQRSELWRLETHVSRMLDIFRG